MKHTARALAFLAALLPSWALAQSAPATMPYHTVYGRLGAAPGDTGPGQAIPFATLNAQLFNSLCTTNNARPIYSTASGKWICEPTNAANVVLAGPTTGAAAISTMRALVGADLPVPGAASLGGVKSLTCSTSNWFSTLSTAGAFGCSQPAFTDITGVATGAQLPNPAAGTLGGVKSLAAIASNFLTSISTAGQPTQARPVCADLSDVSVGCTAARGQLPGETSTGNASAGNVGEYVSTTVLVGSAVSMTTATPVTIATASLTTGDWDVWIQAAFAGTATAVSGLRVSLSTTTNTEVTTAGNFGAQVYNAIPAFATENPAFWVGPIRVSISGTTSYFFVARGDFTGGTCTGYGLLRARRAR